VNTVSLMIMVLLGCKVLWSNVLCVELRLCYITWRRCSSPYHSLLSVETG